MPVGRPPVRGKAKSWAELARRAWRTRRAGRPTTSGLRISWPSRDQTLRSQAVKLQGGHWSLETNPNRGGRITSLRLEGKELLDQGIGIDDPSLSDFVAAGAWGWDEMVPTVDPSRYPAPSAWAGVELPDHGEAWRLEWSVLELTNRSATMQCSGVALPWRLERRIELGDRAVRVDYAYRNEGSQPLYAYWCSHVLFRYEPDMVVEGVEGFAAPAEGASSKLHLPPGSLSNARLRWSSSPGVEIAWDPSLTPHVGVWACNGDLGGYRQIAIEPATGGSDHPDPSAPPPLLGPGEQLMWWLEIRAQ
jgi:galactose mutarotase-like enzyme